MNINYCLFISVLAGAVFITGYGCGDSSNEGTPGAENVLIDGGGGDVRSGDGGEAGPECQFPNIVPKGALDPTFKNGLVDVRPFFTRPSSYHFEPVGIIIDSQGRTIIVGRDKHSFAGRGETPALVRLLPDGTPDPSFGARYVDPPPPEVSNDGMRPAAIAIDDRDRVVIAGGAHMLQDDQAIFIARIDSSGALDPAFGVPLPHKKATAIASIATDGDFVYVSGSRRNPSDGGASTVRFTERVGANGAMDTAFSIPLISHAIAVTPTALGVVDGRTLRSYRKTDGAPTPGFGNDGSVPLADEGRYRGTMLVEHQGSFAAAYTYTKEENFITNIAGAESLTSSGTHGATIEDQSGVVVTNLASTACGHLVLAGVEGEGSEKPARLTHIDPQGRATVASIRYGSGDAGVSYVEIRAIDRRTGQLVVLRRPSDAQGFAFSVYRMNAP